MTAQDRDEAELEQSRLQEEHEDARRDESQDYSTKAVEK